MSDPANSWLAAQRELVERWLNSPPEDAARDQAQQFWRSIADGVSPEARELAQQLLQLGPGFLAGASDSLFALFGAAKAKADDATFGRWLDLAPIGYFREHHAQAQELAQALDEYRRIASRMASAIGRIHTDALELLAKKTQELGTAGQPVSDTRRLYNLWVECSEQSFARHASGEAFGRLQGELVNAGTRVRVAQQTIAEYFLKSLDLPTRSELNSVHKRLKEMRGRIESLEEQLSSGKSSARSKS